MEFVNIYFELRLLFIDRKMIVVSYVFLVFDFIC